MSEQEIYITSSPHGQHTWWDLASSVKAAKDSWQDLNSSTNKLLTAFERQRLDNIISFVYKDGNIIINETESFDETEPFDEAEFEKLLNATGE